jgi:hypothetical protein
MHSQAERLDDYLVGVLKPGPKPTDPDGKDTGTGLSRKMKSAAEDISCFSTCQAGHPSLLGEVLKTLLFNCLIPAFFRVKLVNRGIACWPVLAADLQRFLSRYIVSAPA